MKAWQKRMSAGFLGLLFSICVGAARGDFTFSDTRFQGEATTEALDAIIEAYELYDGWYWTTPADIPQDFHGHPDAPGWTSTAEKQHLHNFREGWYGCRWPVDLVRAAAPDKGGYAECFAFAQFLGYLLTGEINPQHNWRFYYSLKDAGGLRVGDILRTEYTWQGHLYQHSAMVYAIWGEEILFLQVSGAAGDRISIGRGFTDGRFVNVTSEEKLAVLPYLKLSRFLPPAESP